MMSDAAKNIATFLKAHKRSSIAVAFSGPPTSKTSTSQAFVQFLTERLAAHKIRVEDDDKFGVEGKFRLVEVESEDEDSPKRVALAVTMKIVDNLGKVFLDYDLGRTLAGENEVLSLLGASGSLVGIKKTKDRGARIRNSIRNPNLVVVSGTKAKATARSPYAVELLVKKRPRKITKTKGGLGYVEVDLNEEYTLRFSNTSSREVAVEVRIDGLSTFHFSQLRATGKERKGEPKYRFWIVPPRNPVEVPGWHKTDKKSLAFRVTPEGERCFQVGQDRKDRHDYRQLLLLLEEGPEAPGRRATPAKEAADRTR
jgi:hypothetical protein